jgi:ribosomal protein L37AE/L43A
MTVPSKPSEQEEEYFARQEFERRKQALAARAQSASGEDKKQEAAVAQYRCPKCGAELVMVSYKGIEIDKCSQCQGVWLDCGELEQVLEGDQSFLSAVKRIFT